MEKHLEPRLHGSKGSSFRMIPSVISLRLSGKANWVLCTARLEWWNGTIFWQRKTSAVPTRTET
ncbi:hypothetical protein EMPG_15350 [Blastomyces silverae]|uniref:Uncharacterized protein n=1 Tax=Blastomyces silverae TaxID=2060906 RepID=A0A0H1BCN3_9EURO|nr:hypothetical protein EMPG_15350 [Blastomyces silverae]